MNTKTTNTNEEIIIDEFPELPTEVSTSGYIASEEDTSIEAITGKITSTINENSQITRPRNRAERRALAKKLGKKGREQFGTISETARKLNYIDLIQKLREINKENENENTTQDS